MKWLEVNPLPERCIICESKYESYQLADEATRLIMEQDSDFFILDCGSCDYALDRFYLSEDDELKIKQECIARAIRRYKK